MVRNASFLSSKEIWQYISDLKISKVALPVEDIETILDTLVYDGKVEMTVISDGNLGEQVKTYRAVEKLLYSAGVVRIPCGVCPVIIFMDDERNWTHVITFLFLGYAVVWYCRCCSAKKLCLL